MPPLKNNLIQSYIEDEAFAQWKKEEGLVQYEGYLKVKDELASKKAALKKAGISVNTMKKEIDATNAQLAIKRAVSFLFEFCCLSFFYW